MTDKQREAIERLKAMDDITVSAKLIAPALGMSESVLRRHVIKGEYMISKAVATGHRVRFFRKDFLRQIGEIPPDEPERTDSDRLDELIELIRVQNTMLMEISAPTLKRPPVRQH